MNAAFSFDRPPVLAGLFVIVPFVIAWIIRSRKNGGVPVPLFFLSSFFFWIFLVCLVIALAGPRWGTRYTGDYTRGLDAVIAFDLSRSMEVRDLPGEIRTDISRMESGIAAVRETVSACAGVRFGAALGRGRGILAVPLTWDREAFFGFLDGLSPLAVTGRGTNLESLLDAAAGAFEAGFPNRKVIILVSDGEAHTGAFTRALDRARAAGIVVAVLGMGTEEGGVVPGENIVPDSDEPVQSRRRGNVLRRAADSTGGIFVDGNRRNASSLLSSYLMSLAPESRSTAMRSEKRPRRDLFVILALAAFGASKLAVLRKRKKTP